MCVCVVTLRHEEERECAFAKRLKRFSPFAEQQRTTRAFTHLGNEKNEEKARGIEFA